MPADLNELIRATSRSFYLTLRVLPGAIRPQIGLAYLLARTTDTVADTEMLPAAQRLDALKHLRARILGEPAVPLNFAELAKSQGAPAEKLLLEQAEVALAAVEKFSEADQTLIREALAIITSGQELDLRRFAGSSAGKIIALQNGAELDDYTYRVAGCVGEFWTKLCRAHVFPEAHLNDAALLANGVRFGKGLQLVNILRDLPADLKNGRCYLPAENLSELGLAPADLQNPANESRLRPLYDDWLERARAHLAAGWEYTTALPWSCARVRLACAWPVLIGLRTIDRLRDGRVLDPQRRIKISRAEVRGIIFQTVSRYPLPGAWRRLGRAGATA